MQFSDQPYPSPAQSTPTHENDRSHKPSGRYHSLFHAKASYSRSCQCPPLVLNLRPFTARLVSIDRSPYPCWKPESIWSTRLSCPWSGPISALRRLELLSSKLFCPLLLYHPLAVACGILDHHAIHLVNAVQDHHGLVVLSRTGRAYAGGPLYEPRLRTRMRHVLTALCDCRR